MIIGWVIMHFVTDWWFQSRDVAETKTTNVWAMLTHMEYVASGFFIIACTVSTDVWEIIMATVVYAGLHLSQDAMIWSWYKYGKTPDYQYWKDKRFYDIIALDQMLHLIIGYLILSHLGEQTCLLVD